jgi:hypothetical protein
MSDYWLDDRSIRVQATDFPLASVSRPALGPTQPPNQWVPAVLSSEVKRGRDVTLTTHPPPSAEVKNEWELYLLSHQVSSWRVVGQLYFTTILNSAILQTAIIFKVDVVDLITSSAAGSMTSKGGLTQFWRLRTFNVKTLSSHTVGLIASPQLF